jgi:hypothetical protein
MVFGVRKVGSSPLRRCVDFALGDDSMRRAALLVSLCCVHRSRSAETLPELFGKLKEQIKAGSWADALKTAGRAGHRVREARQRGGAQATRGPYRFLPRASAIRTSVKDRQSRRTLLHVPEGFSPTPRSTRPCTRRRRSARVRKGAEAGLGSRARRSPRPTRSFSRRPNRRQRDPADHCGEKAPCAGS